jgi:hypothetical protein
MAGDANDGTGSRPKKRRKKPIPPISTIFNYKPDVCIALEASDSEYLGLADPQFLVVDKLQYVTQNDTKCSYLYTLCSMIFEVTLESLTILKSNEDKSVSEETKDDWEVMEWEDDIGHGKYLVQFDPDSSINPTYQRQFTFAEPTLNVYSFRKSGTSGTPSVSAPSTPNQQTTTPGNLLDLSSIAMVSPFYFGWLIV